MTTQPFRGLHPCRRCGVELDADDRNETCEDCPRLCWRSECRTGCYYPDVCSELPARREGGPTCAHGWPEGGCPACAACAACDGSCGTCPYVIPPGQPCPTCVHPEGYDRLSGPCPTCHGSGVIPPGEGESAADELIRLTEDMGLYGDIPPGTGEQR